MPRIDINEHYCAGVTAFGGVPMGVTWTLSSPEIPAKYLGGNFQDRDVALAKARSVAKRCRTPVLIVLFDDARRVRLALRVRVFEEELDPDELRGEV